MRQSDSPSLGVVRTILADLHRILLRQTTFADAITAGLIKAEGKTGELARFFGFFEAPLSEPPALTAR